MLSKLRNNRGDTIVEVMIVLAVLGLAIGISYATANRSLLNARQAQENTQATQLAQSQVEQLLSIGCTSGNPACNITDPANPGYLLLHPPGGGAFCLSSGVVKPDTDPACQDAALPGSSIQITCLNSCAAPRVFEVTVSWDDVLGEGRDTVTQDYTLPDTVAAIPAPSPGPGPGPGPGPAPAPTPLPFSMTAQNRVCGTTNTGPPFFAPIYQADLVITGTPGDTVSIKGTQTYWWGGNLFSGAFDFDIGTVQIGPGGTVTKSLDYNAYLTLELQATATDMTNPGTAQVQICP